MVNKKSPKHILINVIILIFIVNVILHIIIFGTGIKGILKNGINQIVFGSKVLQISAFSDLHYGLRIYSFFAIVIELILIFYFIFKEYKGKEDVSKELKEIQRLKMHYSASKNQTEIDVLYNILKEKKKIKLSVLNIVFGVDKNTLREWIDSLEAGNLAELKKKSFGELEIVLKKED